MASTLPAIVNQRQPTVSDPVAWAVLLYEPATVVTPLDIERGRVDHCPKYVRKQPAVVAENTHWWSR